MLIFSVFYDDFYLIRTINNRANGYLSKNARADELREALLAIYQDGMYYANADIRNYCRSVLKGEIVLPKFSATELEVMRWCCTELSYLEIADKTNLTKKSLEGHVEHLKQKCEAEGRVGIVLFAIRFGYVHLPLDSKGFRMFDNCIG